jgi:hypothetical protein
MPQPGFMAKIPVDKIESCLKAMGLEALLRHYERWLKNPTERLFTRSPGTGFFGDYISLIAWPKEEFVVLMYSSKKKGLNKVARQLALESGADDTANLRDDADFREQIKELWQ